MFKMQSTGLDPVASESASVLFTRMAEFSKGTSSPSVAEMPREWIWAELPEEINQRLIQWRDMFCKAVPDAKPVDNLHVTLFHELLNLEDDLRVIIATVANAAPVPATLAGLKAFRTEDGIAVAIEVVSHKLKDLRRSLEQRIEHTPSIHLFTPHITLAYVPVASGIEFEGMQLHGIYGTEFVIDSVNAGTKLSNHPCVMLGGNESWNMRFKPTPSVERDAEFGKSAGMSTLSGESGGILMQRSKAVDEEFSIDIDDDEDDESDIDFSGDETDDEDEHWIRRSQDLADSLDDPYGDY